MPVIRRPFPDLPACPRALPIAKEIRRSYPTGRSEFSRAFVGSAMELTITAGEPFPPDTRICIRTTINGKHASDWVEYPFERQNEILFLCRIVPEKTGLFSFWARFSTDGGKTWNEDTSPDAWVLVDPPQVDHMRLYTLIPSVSGTIADWCTELKYIKEMGFNTVHLLPLTTLDTSQSPYSARDLFSVEPSYLDPNGPDGLIQLEAFVATARTLGIRLCFDLVLNHVGVDSNIAKRAPGWIVPDQSSTDGLRRARYWCGDRWLPWNDLVLIDFEHPSQRIRSDVWNYLTEYALFWAHYASQTDGFVRFDNLHSSDKAFVDHVTETLRSEYPNVGVIAEYFTDANTLLNTIPKWRLSLILATPWDSRFVPQLREYLRYIHSISEHVRFFMPITSHDSGSPAQEFGSVESTIPRYVAAALMGTGATGVTQGVEWGIAKKIEFIGRHERLMHPAKPMFADFIRKVNEILVAEPVFRRGENIQFVDNGHEAVIAAWRKDGRPGSPGCLVICSFDIMNEHAFEVDLSTQLGTAGPIQCVDLLTGQQHSFPTARLCMVLGKCAAYVLKF